MEVYPVCGEIIDQVILENRHAGSNGENRDVNPATGSFEGSFGGGEDCRNLRNLINSFYDWGGPRSGPFLL